jgi:phosphatidylinositol alpha-mannosyltransferase
MKIGLVLDTTLDSNAGVQQYFKGLARYLLKNSHNVKFIVPPSENTRQFKGRVLSFGRKIILKGNANTISTVFFTNSKKIKEKIDKEHFDIIHVAAPFSPFLGAKVIRIVKCPVVITYLIYGKDWAYRFLGVFEPSKREAMITIPGKYQVIPSGINVKCFLKNIQKIDKFGGKKINILFLGRLEKRKGIDYLIRAFKIVYKRFSKIRLIIVGDGPERRKLEKLVKKLKLKNVYFEGYVSEYMKRRYLKTADICVFPALYGESFGVVLIESMISGKPTIAFRNEGYKYVLRNTPELLVECKNTNKLADKIFIFCKDKKLREKYGKICLKEARNYSWEIVGKKIESIYKNLLTT